MIMFKKVLPLIIISNLIFSSVTKKVTHSSKRLLEIEIKIDAKTEADLFPISLLIGLPNKEIPKTVINYGNESSLYFKTTQEKTNGYNWINNQKLRNLNVATLHISPITNTNSYYRNIHVQIIFDESDLSLIEVSMKNLSYIIDAAEINLLSKIDENFGSNLITL